jgi:hypothetical protein
LQAGDNLGLSTALVEALAAYDQLTPMLDLDDIVAEIGEIVAAPNGARAAERARGIVATQFEDERILGPYYEAIASVPDPQRAALYVLAARATPADDFYADFIVHELIEHGDLADAETRATLVRFASEPDPEAWHSPQTSASALFAAARGCAQFGEVPPFGRSEKGVARALGNLAELTFWYGREELGLPADEEGVAPIWQELRNSLRPCAAQAFHYMGMADRFTREERIHELLVRRFDGEVRELFEWSLIHTDELVQTARHATWRDLRTYLIEVLAQVGDEDSAALLRGYVDDRAVGREAADAVRAIEGRALGTT